MAAMNHGQRRRAETYAQHSEG
ncbi:uncharacterized protein G2W53_033598 [Senna tora]|uniref:Uncharacterized protein n=1 Tax=Senna tora TaxID=362788 RepID=A0A834T0C9_9FABA|nr:uncharacterized protein G2W53_033598 [Senna tora]